MGEKNNQVTLVLFTNCLLSASTAGLPDVMVLHQKSPLGYILECLAMKAVGKYYVPLVCFTALSNILYPFIIFCGHFGIFFPDLICCNKYKSGNPGQRRQDSRK
jgi:hypothetical protein